MLTARAIYYTSCSCEFELIAGSPSVKDGEQKSGTIASTAADDCKRLQIGPALSSHGRSSGRASTRSCRRAWTVPPTRVGLRGGSGRRDTRRAARGRSGGAPRSPRDREIPEPLKTDVGDPDVQQRDCLLIRQHSCTRSAPSLRTQKVLVKSRRSNFVVVFSS